MLFRIPVDVQNIVNEYEPKFHVIVLKILKAKCENSIKNLKEKEYKIEKLLSWKIDFEKIDPDKELRLNDTFGEAFYNYFTKVEYVMKLPSKIEEYISKNKAEMLLRKEQLKVIDEKIKNKCKHEDMDTVKIFKGYDDKFFIRICKICKCSCLS